MREKLIEVIEQVYFCSIEMLADHLIANGVTFATDNNVGGKWIPVSEPPPKKGCYLLTVQHWADGKPVTREAFWNGVDWVSCERLHKITPRVTHWMPLPEPQKEEK